MACRTATGSQLSSHHGSITVPVKLTDNVQPDTVWTWNAIGKRNGSWGLSPNAPEGNQGFLLNPADFGPDPGCGDYANADPITGQAAWFDLRVSIRKTGKQAFSSPQFAPLSESEPKVRVLRYGAKA